MLSTQTSIAIPCYHTLTASFTPSSLSRCLRNPPPPIPKNTATMLGTSGNHFGPSLDYMLDAEMLTCARYMQKRPLFSGRPSYIQRLQIHKDSINNPVGRHNSLSASDLRCTTQLIASHRSGQEENSSNYWYAWSPPEYEERSLSLVRSPAIQAVHLPHDRLCVPHVEVRCTQPRQEAAGDPSVITLLLVPLGT